MADPLNYLSLFTGIGLLDAGFRLGAESRGFAPRCVGCVERESFPASILLARMEEAALEPAPVWCGDIADLDARPLRGHVGFVIGGPPCQPYSTAGKRVGNDDERSFGTDGRGPMSHMLRIIEETDCWGVFLENVPRWITGDYFASVGERLCELGFTLEAPLFATAKQVGASHRRERVFILAHRMGNSGCNGHATRGRWLQREAVEQIARLSIDPELRRSGMEDAKCSKQRARKRGEQSEAGSGRNRPADGSSGMVHTQRDGGGQHEPERGPDRRTAAGGAVGAMGDAANTGLQGSGQTTERPDGKTRLDQLDFQSENWSSPPGPETATPGNASSTPARGSRRRLNPAFVCWLMGCPWWWTNPAPISFARSEMELWRSRLHGRLQRLLQKRASGLLFENW